MLEYINKLTNQKVKYYISTCIPFHFYKCNVYSSNPIPKLLKDIKQCNMLLICGHMPHYDSLLYLPTEISLIGYNCSVFPKIDKTISNAIDYDEDKILFYLETEKRIIDYIAVESENGNKKVCKTYNDFYKCIELFQKSIL